jgi:hypothetical protein
MLRAKRVVVLFAVGLLLAVTANGQQITGEPTHLALEIHLFPDQKPAYAVVQPAGSAPQGMWTPRFRRIQNWQTPAGALPVSEVFFKSVVAGDVVRVWVSVFVGRHEQEKPVTSFTLHDGEKTTVSELTGFGLEPVEVALIRLVPNIANPAQVVSNAGSIQVVALQAKFATLPTRRLTLRNLSSKNVSALMVRLLQGGRPKLSSLPQGKEGEPLIVAGGTLELDEATGFQATLTPEGYLPDNSDDQIIEIQTAVLTDGSFEGDIEPAKEFRAFVKGRKIQLKKVADLFQKMLTEEPLDAGVAIETLKQEVVELKIDPEPTAIAEVYREFPTLDPRLRISVSRPIQVAMTGIRRQVLEDINEFQVSHRTLDHGLFHQWLLDSERRCEAWFSRL